MGTGVASAAGCLLSEDTEAAGFGALVGSSAVGCDAVVSDTAILSGYSVSSGALLSTNVSVSLVSEEKMLSVLSFSFFPDSLNRLI